MKLLIGGSPCTYWSIAQTKNRETEASGMGWELFRNYVMARDKFQPDYFLYENNKSMSAAIREQITEMLGVEPVLINSALVSAQNRQRLYWVGRRNADGGYDPIPAEQPEDRGILLRDVLESGVSWREKGYALLSTTGGTTCEDMVTRRQRNGVAEPVKPLSDAEMDYMVRETRDGRNHFDYGYVQDGTQDKGKCVTANISVYSPDGKSVTLCGNGGGVGAKTGLYAIPFPDKYKVPPIYEVKDGQITIKGKQYPIKLRDGCYIIRKLTVRECMRLQTVPEDFEFPVSDSQAYKMLGNGWTVDVIVHLMSHFDGITTEPVDVLSMYDGMACGHIALDKLGANIRHYYATEIDKYAIKTAQYNFPDIVELGDAFNIRWDMGVET